MKYLYYFVSKIKIYMQQGSLRYKEHWKRNHDPLAKRDDRDGRYKILGVV